MKTVLDLLKVTIMKNYMKNICLFLMMLGISTHAWGAETLEATFASGTVVTAQGYDDYENDDWYLSKGGASKGAGFNSNNWTTIGNAYGTSANTSHHGFYIRSKNKLNNICKITFWYDYCTTATECAQAKIYLGYSTDGSSWSAVPITSGSSQGTTITPSENPTAGSSSNLTTWTFEFSKITSAYYAIIISRNGSMTSEKGFRFDDATVKFYSGCCDKIVEVEEGTISNCTMSFSTEEVATCSSTATDRRVTVSVTPLSCYAAPLAASVTSSGTACNKISGPTPNGNKYDYVYEFAQNATGTTSFSCSLSTKNTYTINYDKGTYGSGTNTSATKTCGVDLTLAGVTFTRTGYTQTGWSAVASGTSKAYELSGTYSANAGTTLYPYWEANTISLTLNKNNSDASGSTTGSASIKFNGSALESGKVDATRSGYILEGYYADQSCEHKVLTKGGALVNYSGYVESGKWVRATTPTTLYANWTLTYTLTVANVDNVIISSTSPDVAEGGSTGVAGGTTVTLSHNNPTSPYIWGRWNVYDTDNPATSVTVTNNQFTMPNHNVTVDAMLLGDLIGFCEPEITWYNDMTDSEFAHNIASGGVVSLPLGTPESCNSSVLTFDGWVTTTWDNYKTSGFTRVNGGEVITEDATYYAVFKTSNNHYYTKCPTIHSITYKPNGGEGVDYVDYTLNTTATAITVATAGFTNSGCTFIGWSNPDDAEGTIIREGHTISGISSDITLNAIWIGTTNITGTVRLTASAGEKVATGTTDITISSSDFACATALRITYYDVTNDVTYGRSGSPKYTSSEFRLCDGSYNVADESNISLASVTGAYNQTFSITYEPNGGANTLDHYQLKVEVLLKNSVIETKTLDLYGRTLPATFVIATKIGSSWYALPNNMPSEGTYDPILISVTEDANVLNWVAQGPSIVGYTMKDYTTDYSRLRFAAADANAYCLWAAVGDDANIRNWSASSAENNYAWTAAPQDMNFNVYTMSNKANTRTGLKIQNNQWRMYNSGGYSEIHFIPLTTVETIDIIAREWKADGLIFSINADNKISLTTGDAKYGIGAVATTDATLARLSTGGYGLYSVELPDLSSYYGQVLALQMKINGVNKNAYTTIPIIVSSDKSTKDNAPFNSMLKEESADYDVVVLSGVTLTTNATASNACKFHNLYLYPGARLVNTANGNLALNYLELRAGIPSYTDLNGELAVPNVYLGKKLYSCTNGANLDMYIDVRHDYPLSVPFAVNLANVKYANALRTSDGTTINGTLNSQFRVSYYSAQQRATTSRGWVDIASTSTTLSPGTGYVIQAKRPTGQPLAVLRFPFTANPTTWSDNTNGEVEKGAISISGYGADDEDVSDNNKGWNLIANPYSAKISYAGHEEESAFNGNISVGYLEKEMKDGKWTGKYVYKGSTNAYVTIPNDSYTVYTQSRSNAVTFYPYKNFFVQAKTNTGSESVTFNRAYRQQAPAFLMAENQISQPQYVDIDLTHSANTVTAGLTIDPDATPGYSFTEDENIFENRDDLNYLKLYTIEDGHYLVGNTLNPTELSQLIPVEFYAPDVESGYQFSLHEGSDIDEVESLILLDNQENSQTDLLGSDYNFTIASAGFVENRFFINLTLKEDSDVHTAITNTRNDSYEPYKFIYNGKLYILRNGFIYDATGKKVREINK